MPSDLAGALIHLLSVINGGELKPGGEDCDRIVTVKPILG